MLNVLPHRDVHENIVRDHYDLVADTLFALDWYRDDRITGFIHRNVPVYAKNILDLCSGPGNVACSFSEKGAVERYDLVDISTSACSIACERLQGKSFFRIFCGDWTDPIRREKYDVIILKNCLHVIDNVALRLAELKHVLRQTGIIILVETVSPTKSANDFVRQVFQLADLDLLKSSFYTAATLRDDFARAGASVMSHCKFIDQKIDVIQWLRSKAVSAERIRRVARYIEARSFSSRLQKEMGIMIQREASNITMLRRQACFVLTFSANSTCGVT